MEDGKTIPGTILSADLTVARTEQVRDFYEQVVGWKHTGLSMGSYDDYVMAGADGEPVAGICHPEGENAALPPVWLVYFSVENLQASLEACRKLGGRVHYEPKAPVGSNSYAVIEYPQGAYCAIAQI